MEGIQAASGRLFYFYRLRGPVTQLKSASITPSPAVKASYRVVRPRRPMKISVRHQSEFVYSEQVNLGPHTLRFMPRSEGTQQLLDFDLHIHPKPGFLSHTLDVEGNQTMTAWFNTPADALVIDVKMLVEVKRDNPFDYIPDNSAQQPPVRYSEFEQRFLRSYLEHSYAPEVEAFTTDIIDQSNNETLTFLHRLNHAINGFYHHGVRLEGDARTPAETLRLEDGVCRDLAVLYVDCCRQAGIAARFVSGYQSVPDSNNGTRHLHAWPEVYIPGGGWRGYDPTHDLAVSDQHVAICASVDPARTQPIAGAFSSAGKKASSKLRSHIEIHWE